VLSDFGQPPKRAWQAKNVKQIDWDDCRDSLRQAMSTEHPPPHYTLRLPTSADRTAARVLAQHVAA